MHGISWYRHFNVHDDGDDSGGEGWTSNEKSRMQIDK